MRSRLIPITLCLFLLLPSSLAAQSGSEPIAMAPEFEVTIADAGVLKKLFRENAWMRDFSQSNLYRGTMVRLGPVLFAVAKEKEDSWKGRLVDYLAEKLLDGRPLKVSYFHHKGLVSPFGLTLSLSSREKDAVRLLLAGLRNGSVARDVEVENGGIEKVTVTAIEIRTNKFAAVERGDCLTLSRDPDVAAVLSTRCGSALVSRGASIRIDTGHFFSSWSAITEKLLGLGPEAKISFGFDSKGARFVPSQAEMALNQRHIFGSGTIDKKLLAAMPSDTLLALTAFVPDPGRLDPSSIETYLRTVKNERRGGSVPITFVYLGMTLKESMSALIVPQTSMDDATVAAAGELFNQKRVYEVQASRACRGFLVLSPSAAALERIEQTCEGKRPSFNQLPPKVVSSYLRGTIATAAFVNAGGFLRATVAFGAEQHWIGKQGEPLPPEITDAMTLLDQLPMYAFTGNVSGDKLLMVGVEP